MTASATIELRKLAWLRDPSVPQGQRALGRLECPCGHTIQRVEYSAARTYTCECGTVYTGKGWIDKRTPAQRARDAADGMAPPHAGLLP